MIPQANPRAQYLAHKDEIDAAVVRVLEGGWYILGQECVAFEREFAAYCGVAHAVGVGSGTEALHLALAACGVGQGDEVIAPAHTAVATVAAIELAGAAPVLVDIDPRNFNLDPGKLEAAITPRTKALVPVHLYGQAADLDPVLAVARRHALRVVEDCAQAVGALYRGRRVGSWGDIAAFSFYPTKNLGALGDGGMVVTSDPELAERAGLLRQYGWRTRYISERIGGCVGWNTRLDELQAAILRVKLSHLEEDTALRRRWAALYDELVSTGDDLALPSEMPYGQHVYHLYVVRHPRRDALQAYLKERGVGALIHYPAPIHLQPAYRGRLGDAGSFPQAERATREALSLPLYPELIEEQVRTVAGAVNSFNF
ncbi:MAG: DegT/DnrJ/EryC1/StrS family aminotransferase [Thermoflexales bacterium]|nr:DegT/DnrJ/EryC1/StrS family aminotransferase [Thermoflexales bacterium]